MELNASNPDVRVNYLECCEFNGKKLEKRFVWITNYELLKSNVFKIGPMGRSRWKIENETFNTLKNHGYGYEHNYGHGKKNLSVIFSTLMLLAFAVDQTLERCCKVFQAARQHAGTKKVLWEKLRTLIEYVPASRMEDYYEVVARTNSILSLINST